MRVEGRTAVIFTLSAIAGAVGAYAFHAIRREAYTNALMKLNPADHAQWLAEMRVEHLSRALHKEYLRLNSYQHVIVIGKVIITETRYICRVPDANFVAAMKNNLELWSSLESSCQIAKIPLEEALSGIIWNRAIKTAGAGPLPTYPSIPRAAWEAVGATLALAIPTTLITNRCCPD